MLANKLTTSEPWWIRRPSSGVTLGGITHARRSQLAGWKVEAKLSVGSFFNLENEVLITSC